MERGTCDSSLQNPKRRYSVEETLPEARCSSREENGPVGDVTGDNRRTFREKKIFVFFAYGPLPVPRVLTGIL